MLLGLKRISAAFGLLVIGGAVATAQTPNPAPVANQNQATANAVASSLKSSKTLSAYRIDIESKDGKVTLTGSVPNATQKREVIARVNKVSGVASVVDQIRVVDNKVRPVQYQTAMNGGGNQIFHKTRGMAAEGAPMMEEGAVTSQPTAGPVMDGSPIPEGSAVGGHGAGAMGNQPNYAWPSYAPNSNFSAVGYPTAYPWQAWPNIGPMYPYPEVPQDWRAVTLRWDDGIWWLDFKKNYTRPFFTPYPFGIFAY